MADQVSALRARLEQALAECERLRRENERLTSLLGQGGHSPPAAPGEAALPAESPPPPPGVCAQSPAAEKVALFQSLFHGRDNLYAVRWESKVGRSGYSPACSNEWVTGICEKPRVKCGDCAQRVFLPLGEETIEAHLRGTKTVGVYPLLEDETCWFLAADFDKAEWQDDARAFGRAAQELDVPAAVERSRSGRGAHVWIFFSHPVPARLARELGSAILTRAMESRYRLGMDSYDRLFPSQDTMPKGGFGSLIALPLQGGPRQQGNSLFVDGDFRPYPDQWAYLSTLARISPDEVTKIVSAAQGCGAVLGVAEVEDEDIAKNAPWQLPPSGRLPLPEIRGSVPAVIRGVLSNLLYIEKHGLPPALLNRILRVAAFQNPEFYRAQAMRLNTFGKPRIISCAEDHPNHIAIPRGCTEEVLRLLEALGVELDLHDERHTGERIDISFRGELRDRQRDAAKTLSMWDTGVLSAGTAFGKTVVASWMIARRGVSTLVLVHRTQLLEQWRERLATFLGLADKEIGQIGGSRSKITGRLDVAMLQSLVRKGQVKDLVAEYGHVVVDECHHVSAFAFEQVLRKVKARYILGLTATPIRKDGHHPIITMQCGPIRVRLDSRREADHRPFDHVVRPRRTGFQVEESVLNAGIQALYGVLAEDQARNDIIFHDLVEALDAGRSPLLLTERVDHLETFERRLVTLPYRTIVFRGGMGKRHRRALMEELAAIPEDEKRVILATGRYIGEGFDDARLDTLFLALPISWKGTLQQYAGRLHRQHAGKEVVQIYDYVDAEVPVLQRMYQRRLKGYRAMGYEIAGGDPPETA